MGRRGDTQFRFPTKTSYSVRYILVFASTALAINWLFATWGCFFVIVPADSVGTPEALDAERVPIAGAALFIVSFVSIGLPTGILGRRRSFIVTLAMLKGQEDAFEENAQASNKSASDPDPAQQVI